MDTMLEMISFVLRLISPAVALLIVCLGFYSLKGGRREEHALIVLENDQEKIAYPVLYWENSIGRSRGSDIRIGDPTVSRDHAVLLRRNDGWFIADTGSKMGVYVNGERTVGRCPVGVGDVITMGETSLVLRRSAKRPTDTKKKKESRTISSGLIMTLLTIYMGLLTAQACVNMKGMGALTTGAGFVVVMWVFYILSCTVFKRKNFELEAMALMLSGTGVIMAAVHNTDTNQALVQLAAVVLGIMLYCFMLWFIEIPDRVMKWHLIISVLALLLLGATLVLGSVQNGAKNWIRLGPLSVQPSEFAKVAYIFVGASTLDVLQTKKSLTEFVIVSALSVALLGLMSDFGTAVIFFVTFLVIAFMRSGDVKTVVLAVAAAALAVIMILSVKPYIAERFAAWGHVWEMPDDSGYQQVRSMIYIASGGLFGVGLSQGFLQYLFASENDLVFALVSEEAGFIIALLIPVTLGGFMIYARGVATRSRSTFYSIAACSAGGLLVFQAALNIFGITDILPLTGVTLPFVSYGGSSVAACWGLLAFIRAADERTYSHKLPKAKKQKTAEEEPEFVEV